MQYFFIWKPRLAVVVILPVLMKCCLWKWTENQEQNSFEAYQTWERSCRWHVSNRFTAAWLQLIVLPSSTYFTPLSIKLSASAKLTSFSTAHGIAIIAPWARCYGLSRGWYDMLPLANLGLTMLAREKWFDFPAWIAANWSTVKPDGLRKLPLRSDREMTLVPTSKARNAVAMASLPEPEMTMLWFPKPVWDFSIRRSIVSAKHTKPIAPASAVVMAGLRSTGEWRTFWKDDRQYSRVCWETSISAVIESAVIGEFLEICVMKASQKLMISLRDLPRGSKSASAANASTEPICVISKPCYDGKWPKSVDRHWLAYHGEDMCSWVTAPKQETEQCPNSPSPRAWSVLVKTHNCCS